MSGLTSVFWHRRGVLTTAFLQGVVATLAHAVVLFDTADPAANTTAPTGTYADSGWAYQGEYGGFLGTMIAPQYFITAQHFDNTTYTEFTSTSQLNGGVDVTYTVDTAANGGTGFWNIPNTDLRVVKINETFSSYAPLYTGPAVPGADLVVFGRGGPRGTEVFLEGDLKGWSHTTSDGIVRWGANKLGQIVDFGYGDMLRASFDPISGQNEATLSPGDSGGAVFINDGGVWKLAGINFGVDGSFDTNNVLDDNEFEAALFDRGGYYQGGDGVGWFGPYPDGSAAGFYSSWIPSNVAAIQSIVTVPEPGSLMLLGVGLLLAVRRRR